MEKKNTSGTLPPEWRIVSAVNGWLERHWRRGKVSAKAKASLCNALTGLLASTCGVCELGFLQLTIGLRDTLEEIRHVRSNCTQRFMNALVKYVGEGNAALRDGGVGCPPLSIPLRGGEGARGSVSLPAGAADRDRTLVSVGTAPVTLEGDALGRTVVSITIVRGRVTVNVTQDQSPSPCGTH